MPYKRLDRQGAAILVEALVLLKRVGNSQINCVGLRFAQAALEIGYFLGATLYPNMPEVWSKQTTSNVSSDVYSLSWPCRMRRSGVVVVQIGRQMVANDDVAGHGRLEQVFLYTPRQAGPQLQRGLTQ